MIEGNTNFNFNSNIEYSWSDCVTHTQPELLSLISLKGQICEIQDTLEIFIVYCVSFSLKTLHPRVESKDCTQVLIAQGSLPLIPAEAQCVACLESAHTILLVTADKKLTPASPGLTAHSDSPGAQGISHTDSCQARIVICYVKLRPSLKLNTINPGHIKTNNPDPNLVWSSRRGMRFECSIWESSMLNWQSALNLLVLY